MPAVLGWQENLMDIFLYMMLVFGIPLLIIGGIVTALIIGIIKGKKWLKIIPIVVLALLAYIVWGAFFPGKDFFRNEFENVVGIEYPKDARILLKKATFPDTHGDYSAVALIELTPTIYEQLLEMSEAADSDTMFIGSDSYYWLEEKNGKAFDFESKTMNWNNKNEFRFWGLIRNERKLIIYFASS